MLWHRFYTAQCTSGSDPNPAPIVADALVTCDDTADHNRVRLSRRVQTLQNSSGVRSPRRHDQTDPGPR